MPGFISVSQTIAAGIRDDFMMTYDPAFKGELENLADAIAILDFLFGGGRVLRCAKAADANDDGAVQITDAVFLLGHLFSGTAAPPEPYPARGLDPTPDGLPCTAP